MNIHLNYFVQFKIQEFIVYFINYQKICDK